jgi:hypothetical protein
MNPKDEKFAFWINTLDSFFIWYSGGASYHIKVVRKTVDATV